MSGTSPNQSRFRIYALMWVNASVLVVATAFVLADPPTLFTVVYFVLAGVLWGGNMALNGTRRADAATQDHRLAHALLTAAAALVWPLTLALVVVILAGGVVSDLWREAGAP